MGRFQLGRVARLGCPRRGSSIASHGESKEPDAKGQCQEGNNEYELAHSDGAFEQLGDLSLAF